MGDEGYCYMPYNYLMSAVFGADEVDADEESDEGDDEADDGKETDEDQN